MPLPTLEQYYAWRMDVAEYCQAMTDKGVRVDEELITNLEATFESKKLALFPYTMETTKQVSRKCKTCKGRGYKGWKIEGFAKIPLDCPDCDNGIVYETKSLAKPKKVWHGPFNPNSPSKALAWFSEHGIVLTDQVGKPSLNKAIVLKKLDKLLKPYGLELDPRTGELINANDDNEPVTLPEPVDMLLRVAQKKCAGKGLKSWFDGRYIKNGRVHARFNPCGTSTGRLSSSSPNFQNRPRQGFGKEVAKVIVAEKGMKCIKADASQLEFRICVWLAGSNPSEVDGAFDKLVLASEGKFKAAADRNFGGNLRDVAKSVCHASSYLEGISLKSKSDLDDPRAYGDRKAGALLVFDGQDLPEWIFRGKYVCFTGANLAERLFGDRVRDSRRLALECQSIYFKMYPMIRKFQRDTLIELEPKNSTLYLSSGHPLRFYNRIDEEDCKQACAFKGQGNGSVYIQEGMLEFKRRYQISNLQVHDELDFCDIPQEWSDATCLAFMHPMVMESKLMPGFSCPAKVKVGPNLGDMREIGEIRL